MQQAYIVLATVTRTYIIIMLNVATTLLFIIVVYTR